MYKQTASPAAQARPQPDGTPVTAYSEDELKIRAAWLYYVEGNTQERISEQLSVSRMKIHRLLVAAREEGVIQFRIRDKADSCFLLEEQLLKRFGLTEAIVVPRPAEAAAVHLLVAQAASLYLANAAADAMTIGVGWGRTLNQALRRMTARPLKQATVVSLLGGLTKAQPLNPTECAWELAEKIDAACYLLPVPAYADRPEMRDAFMSQRAVQEVINRARRADMALVSVGSLGPEGTISNYGFLDIEEFEELKALGATGDILCSFLGEDGGLIDHPVNRRVCAFPPEELSRIPKVVIASGGYEKVGVLRAALALTRASVLITDETAALGLLAG